MFDDLICLEVLHTVADNVLDPGVSTRRWPIHWGIARLKEKRDRH